LQKLDVAYVTLHVGLGTFLPVKSADIRQHNMHAEHYSISAETCTRQWTRALPEP